MIHEIRFKPQGGGVWYPDTFQDFVAQQCDSQSELMQSLMWYENGMPKKGSAQIAFIGGKNWVGIRAYGDEHAITIYQASIEIARKLDQSFKGQPHEVTMLRFADDAIEKDRHMIYKLNKLAFSRPKSAELFESGLMDRLMAYSKTGETPYLSEQEQETVLNLIGRDLRKQLGSELWFSVEPLERLTWKKPVKTGTSLRFTVAPFSFKLNHFIKRPIQVGSLRSRGFGDVLRQVGKEVV